MRNSSESALAGMRRFAEGAAEKLSGSWELPDPDRSTDSESKAEIQAKVTANWEKFFSSATAAAAAKALLENGDQLGPALKKAQQEDKSSGGTRSAKVTKITFTSATNARVDYKLHVGQTNLNSAGMAVLQDGIWKVSKVTFCTLVELGNGQRPVASC